MLTNKKECNEKFLANKKNLEWKTFQRIEYQLTNNS